MSPSTRYPCHLFALMASILPLPAGAQAAGLAFSPASLDFGANALGESKTKAATLKNATKRDIARGAATLVDNPGGYAIAGTTCGQILPKGQSCKY